MNNFMTGVPRPEPAPQPFQRGTQILQPASTFLFIDVEPASICLTTFRVPDSDYILTVFDGFYSAPGAFHDNGVVLSFSDGHTETHKWVNPSNRDPNAIKGGPHPSPSDVMDVRWLRRRSHHKIK